MNMEEQLKQKKIAQHELDSIKRDITNKEREISQTEMKIGHTSLLIKLKEEQYKINDQQQEVIINNYKKKEDKCDFMWEVTEDYWKINKKLQENMHEQSQAELYFMISQMKESINILNDNLEGLQSSLEMNKARLEEAEAKEE